MKRAGDRVEYAETAAWYECLNLANDEQGEGLSSREVARHLRRLRRAAELCSSGGSQGR